MEGEGERIPSRGNSKEQAESWKHMPWCRMRSSPVRLERKGAHKLKRRIRFRFLVNHNYQEVYLHITLSEA